MLYKVKTISYCALKKPKDFKNMTITKTVVRQDYKA